MSNASEFFSPFPVDVRTLWDANGKSLDYAEKAYRAWLEAAGEMQDEAIAFLNARLEKDSAAVTRLGRCTTPVEVLSVQADYAGNMFADLVNESQKMAAYFDRAARFAASSQSAHAQKQTGHTRTARRAATQ